MHHVDGAFRIRFSLKLQYSEIFTQKFENR